MLLPSNPTDVQQLHGKSGAMQKEVVPVSVPQRRGEDQIIAEDEEYTNVKLEKYRTTSCLFKRRYRYAANASTINDGAAALVLMSEEKASSLGITPLATI